MRDHLANERTLLAWVRTALALMAFGVAVAKLATFLQIAALDHPDLAVRLPAPLWSKMLGVALVLGGFVTVVLGSLRTRHWSREVRGAPPPSATLWVMSVATMIMAVGVSAYILLG
ncbi:MAG: DUF202 domain-containing protein [Deltaproteobacteria bacterium]|nr:MAG: DUF202 domain-containing protein [Deltaproteobacteria bacterium]